VRLSKILAGRHPVRGPGNPSGGRASLGGRRYRGAARTLPRPAHLMALRPGAFLAPPPAATIMTADTTWLNSAGASRISSAYPTIPLGDRAEFRALGRIPACSKTVMRGNFRSPTAGSRSLAKLAEPSGVQSSRRAELSGLVGRETMIPVEICGR